MGEMKNIQLAYPNVSGELALILWYLDHKLQVGRACQWDSEASKEVYINTLEDIKDYIETMA